LSNPRLLTSGIRDNLNRGSVGDFLQEKIKPDTSLSIVSAYFTINAYAHLQAQLDAIRGLRFLFGEPRFLRDLDPRQIEKKVFHIVDVGITLANKLEQKRIARECAAWIESKVEIRSVKRAGLLHGKMYHISGHGRDAAILGSSNFTMHGLGLGADGNNIELNLIVDSERDRDDLRAWFDELWGDETLTQNVKREVLDYLAQLYQNHTPEFIYYKTLFHIFEDFLSKQTAGGLDDVKSQIVDTDIWKTLFEFQRDGVKGAINKILKHNGCIIADSVGLGKTFTALAIIKYFELRNDRVLVLCPKKLRENWTVYRHNDALNPFIRDRFRYDVLSHTDLSRDRGKSGDIDLATINWGNYDLVVIDESHNFRNNTRGKKDEEGQVIRKSRYQRLMDDILKQGAKTKVLMLSATPVNTSLVDLRNQIYFISEGRDDAFRESLGIANLKRALDVAQKQFNEWAKQNGERDTRVLLQSLSSAFFKLLDELTIARSRKHIQRYYADSVAALGGFPKRLKPLSLYADIDSAGEFLSYDQLNDEIEKYKLSLFNPAHYLLPEARGKYLKKVGTRFTQEDIEHYLIGMMKVNFLKRLESSIEAFEITMRRTLEKIRDLQERIERFKELQEASPNFDPEELDDLLEADEEAEDVLQVGEKLVYSFADLKVDAWLQDLKKDEDQIAFLYLEAQKVTAARDAKLQRLQELIRAKVQQPPTTKEGKPNKKVLVFTAFADTAQYLYANLAAWAQKELGIETAVVTGGNDNHTTFDRTEFHRILTNFSPRSKQRAKISDLPQGGEIDLLIATDCISEGQNLQDCDYLVNYDIHWNPVRVIQRFGRIDRIGSRNHTVQLVNFWPTNDLEKYIALKERVEARMALVDIAATNEDNVLDTTQLEDLVRDDLKYRDRQLLKLKDEILDLEDFNESVSLTDFTLDDFRIDLANYIASKRQELEDAPFGLYAVVPPDPAYPLIQPGVIFCLQQKNADVTSSAINPLQPYFLVYVLRDKTVRLTFAQPKQILEMYRALCAGKKTPYEELCALFDAETQNGADMTRYNALLDAAVRSIENTFTKRALGALKNSRDAVLPEKNQQANTKTDFELVTWLVIR
jgi:SNF2 family DNA or RNA helicase